MRTILTTTTSSLTYTDTNSTQRSTWHSPIPYLFGGLAAMLGLIAFALLILACSYWKLTGLLHSENEQRDLENGPERENDPTEKNESMKKVYDEKVLVIMAGNDKPTFLATPACANCTSLCHGVGKDYDKQIQNHETSQRLKENMDNDIQATTTTSHQSYP
ncbi:hypothetical protein TanjilG_09875 [Lupinus angustifolius]|uniref:Uncharacterized protein n=1 Tax=Lupinus angustifolius TaxID=3871 RepID=A0A4P1QWN6_LUPAN|nr:PREDICTED: protein GLUTAMINE DUMPER 5-like [Lupinus angustifolius]OIV96448.1 hypothetical protein TanjilG_09875 [Lupinus angustifolius]